MSKLLITGSNGQLGRELQAILAAGRAPIGPIDKRWSTVEVVPTDVAELDICDADAVMSFVGAGNFDYLINCAAATNVDGCETDPDFAYKLNAEAAGNLARAAQATGARLVHVSTDYVLSGTDPMPQTEEAPVAPNTAYGKTKLAGEELVLELCPEAIICRTAWLYGTEGKNFIRTMVGLGRKLDSVSVVCDQHGSPTFAGDLAYEILALLAAGEKGLFHVTANGATTWDVFARRIMTNAGLACEVVSVSTEQYKQQNPASAPRPAWSILDNKHLRDSIGDHMRSWDVALDEFMRTVEL